MSPVKTAFLLPLVAMVFASCGRSTHWEVELHDRDTTLALTFRDSSGSYRQTVVLDGVTVGVLKPRSYRLPDDVAQLQHAQLEFSDITLRPGRVRFLLHGHSFDVMQRTLIIDGQERSWTAPDELRLKSPPNSEQPQRLCAEASSHGCGLILLNGLPLGLAAQNAL